MVRVEGRVVSLTELKQNEDMMLSDSLYTILQSGSSSSMLPIRWLGKKLFPCLI